MHLPQVTDSLMARKFGRFWNTSRHVRDFCETLDGFGTGDWQTFRTTIEALYPSAATGYTKLDLEDFVDISAMSRVKNEGDVMLY